MSIASTRWHQQRRTLVVAFVTSLCVFLIPLAVIALTSQPEPELRITDSRERVSVLIADGDVRVLVINTHDRELARALPGRLNRPWEPQPQLLISPSDGGAAIGLWELLQSLRPEQVIVAGVPGADPLWSAIEEECRRRSIELTFVAGRVAFETERLDVTVVAPAPETTNGRVVVVERSDTAVVIMLDNVLPIAGQLVVSSQPVDAPAAELIITSHRAVRAASTHEVIIANREVVRVSLEPEQVRVQGGTHRDPVEQAR